jgi:hypothetical protein
MAMLETMESSTQPTVSSAMEAARMMAPTSREHVAVAAFDEQARRHAVPEQEAGAEGQDDSHRAGEERGAAQKAQEAQVQLQPGAQDEEDHPQPGEHLEQVLLLLVRGKERRVGGGPEVAEDRRPEEDAGEQLAEHGGLAELARQGAEAARQGQHHRELQQEDEDGVLAQRAHCLQR